MRFRSAHDQPCLARAPAGDAALEAVAYSSIKLARQAPDPELSMDLLVTSAVLEFADDLRAAGEAATEWDPQLG